MDSFAATTPAASVSSTTTPQTKYRLSCTACRVRKVRCDRVHPCSHCTRAGVDCVFPSRKRMERPRKSKNSELLNRISRLESIVSKVDLEALKEMDMSDQGSPAASVIHQPQDVAPSLSEHTQSLSTAPQTAEAEATTSQEGDHPSKYMSGEFWSNLCNEVEGLKQALGQSTDSDSEDDSESVSPETQHAKANQPFSTQGILAGYPSPDSATPLVHPITARIKYLVKIFFERVDPIVKILHRPSTYKLACLGVSNSTPAQEALMFSIYFAAIASLPATASIFQQGEDQMTMFKNHQLDVERALAAADYLNNNELECLQAMTLYVACLRVHNDTRATWVLTAVLLRLAQAYNLNRDGDGSRYSPFVADMRRRLWWQIVVLDIRAAEDRGTEAMIASDSYNTRLPLNINDDDYGPDSPGPLVERTGPSDVTFSLCSAQSSGIFLWVGFAQSNLSNSPSGLGEEEVIAKAQSLESQFVTNADLTHFQSALAATLVRLINLKLWLILQYPIHPPAAGQKSRRRKVPRETTLQTVVSVMEVLEYNFSTDKERVDWWATTYTQWHPLAVALAELCAQTRGPLVDRAWNIVEVVYPKWGRTVADSKSGTLWRPIRKLYKKAKAARAAAVAQDADGVDALGRLDLIAGDKPWAFQGSSTAANDTSRNNITSNNPGSINPYIDGAAHLLTPATGPSPGDEPSFAGMPPPPLPELYDGSTTSVTGWPEINFDMLLDTSNAFDPMNWPSSGVWNEFLIDTFDSGSGTGSSENNFQ
jgi:hypothetical protein